MKGYISSYTLFILSIYLIIISTYSQYSIKLKTIHNIQIYYDSIISDKLKRVIRMTHSYLPLILTGFMGTGKSTIGKYLASKLHYSYIDLDTYIEMKRI